MTTAHRTGVTELADRVAAAVTACPGVVRLASGPIATYLPGRTVHGVAVGREQVTVAIVAAYGLPLPEVADRVRAAAAAVAPDLDISVHIEDIEESETDG
jgi:hypothetical protein